MNAFGELTDQLLLIKIKQGDTNAFAELYDHYWPLMWRFASGSVANPDDAKDIVQDVFSTFWKNRVTLNIQISLYSFLYRATLNRIIDWSRKAKTAETYLQHLKAGYEEGHYTTDNQIFEKELYQKFRAALEEMPPKMRTIFELSRIEQKTHSEISEEMDISRENVKRQIKNGLIIMKKRMLSTLLFFL